MDAYCPNPDFQESCQKTSYQSEKNLDKAVKVIYETPDIGGEKVGNLAGVRVYKFKMVEQLMLLAYFFEQDTITPILLALGSHKSFYRDLKR